MSAAPILILGCGYTGVRVAARLLARGERVIAASREPEKLQHLPGVQAIRFGDPLPIKPGMRVLHSLPVPFAAQIHGADDAGLAATVSGAGDPLATTGEGAGTRGAFFVM